jgi:hypothetical protein
MYPILAIDQGTTSTKAYLRHADGSTHLIGNRTHRQIRPNPGWVEHDALELLENIRALLLEAGPFARLGLANQGETVVAWDAQTKRPLYNAIVWQDDRTSPETERLKAEGQEALTLSRAGLPLDPYFSATKLRWLLDNAPDARDLHRQGRLRLGTSEFSPPTSPPPRAPACSTCAACSGIQPCANCSACRWSAWPRYAPPPVTSAGCPTAPPWPPAPWTSKPPCSATAASNPATSK